jgi:1-acyl-sn-glycerol-3-phosphate acyltransferase
MKKWFVNHVIKFILDILLKIDDSELKRVPQRGPLVVVANHVNFLDAPVLITHLHPRPTTGLVKKETWEKPLMAFLFNVWGGIPIDRDIADFTAFRKAKEALREEKILAVAPEGTRTEDGKLIRGKPGVAMLVSQMDVPILPLAYYGHENFKENIKKLKRTTMTIRVGEPFHIRLNGNPKNKSTMQDVTDAIMVEIAKLLPNEYRGVYEGLENKSNGFVQYLD